MQQPEQMHEGALAGARGTHDRHHLAGGDVDVDTAKGIDARPARQPVGLAQVGRFDQVHRSLLHHS
jgi:hypothetical protein